MRNRTQQVSRTQQSAVSHSEVTIAGKDPNFDYSFRRKKDIDDGGGMDLFGFEPVSEENFAGETWGGPRSMQTKSKGRKSIVYQDTILCKRPLETANWFKRIENEKYNSQCRLVKTAGQSANIKLRELDPGAVVVDSSSGLDKAFPQRQGPTQEA